MFENAIYAVINVIVALLFAPILDGIRRKLVARLQNRIGPPILQTFYDILKLFRKDTLVPRNSSFLVRIMPIFSFLLSITIILALPTIIPEIPVDMNIVLFLHLLILSAFLLAISGSVSNNPYGIVGGSREIVLVSIIEPSLVMTVLIFSLVSGETVISEIISHYELNIAIGIATVMFIFIMIAEVGRVPFDIAEAESEVSGGPTIEYSGKLLAFYKYSHLIRNFIIFVLFANFVIPIPAFDSTILGYLAFSVIFILKLLLCVLIVSLAEALNARLRIFEALKYALLLLIASFISLLLTIIGVSSFINI